MTIRLLLVEDDEDDYILTRDLLDEIAPDQFQLEWADTPAKGRALMALNQHHVCLMDYRLGSEDGINLLKEAVEIGYYGPIIMLTGQDDSELDAIAMRSGAVDYLVKSRLSAAHLSRAIRYALSRREMEVERIERLKAESENRSKSEFLAHLSHEIRTPLTAILGFTDLLLAKDMSGEDLKILRTIQRNGQHLRSLLNDVLDLSKIEAGKLELEFSRIALNDFLADIYSFLFVHAEDKGLSLKFYSEGLIPLQIETDPVRLRQSLINLLGNALKFTETGSVELKVYMLEEEEQEKLAFEVVDTGPGISEENQQRLFRPFSQVYQRTAGQEGTGLGLAISRQLVQRLGGDISLKSALGHGSNFIMTVIPGYIEEEPRAELKLDFNLHELRAYRPEQLTGTILVVDDVEDIRHLVGQWVRQTGASLMFAGNGKVAVEQMQRCRAQGRSIDLILMDMQMPVLDGHEATRELRKLGFEQPIIALTAATMKGEREKCLTSGCTDFLSKPLNPSQLFRKIHQYLQSDTPASASRTTLLLVEDDRDAGAATAALLTHLGWEVMVAGTGQEALQQIAGTQPEVVLLDLNLPDIDGYRLAARMRESGLEHSRIYALSGEAVDFSRAEQVGIDEALLKPVSLDTLKEISAR